VVKLSTHSAGGSRQDFALAVASEEFALGARPGAAHYEARRTIRCGPATSLMPDRVLFVTGRIAEPSLRRVPAQWRRVEYDVTV